MTTDNNGLKHTDGQEHRDICSAMTPFFDDGKPQVGIFWYNPSAKSLFGVEKIDADLASFVNGKATIGKLHKTYWQKQHHRAQAKGDTSSIFYSEQNYTMIPRGRIFLDEASDRFQVFIGHWLIDGINGVAIDQDDFRDLIIDEFNLPDNTDFVIDLHWDLGHGWSEEFDI